MEDCALFGLKELAVDACLDLGDLCQRQANKFSENSVLMEFIFAL
jgi:hypothetical protein